MFFSPFSISLSVDDIVLSACTYSLFSDNMSLAFLRSAKRVATVKYRESTIFTMLLVGPYLRVIHYHFRHLARIHTRLSNFPIFFFTLAFHKNLAGAKSRELLNVSPSKAAPGPTD